MLFRLLDRGASDVAKRASAALAVLLASAALARYEVVGQSGRHLETVLGARAYYVEPVDFSKLKQELESPEKWAEHTAAWGAAFREEFHSLARDELPEKTIGEYHSESTPGVVVRTRVVRIDKGDWIAKDERVVANVVFFDSVSRRRLFKLRVETSCAGGYGPQTYTFGGRVKFAIENLARAIVHALRGDAQ
jgi:hypothetical protein